MPCSICRESGHNAATCPKASAQEYGPGGKPFPKNATYGGGSAGHSSTGVCPQCSDMADQPISCRY